MNKPEKPALRRYFFDTEFNDTGVGFGIDFLSIGIVDEQGNEYYGIHEGLNVRACMNNIGLRENIFNKLAHHSEWQSLQQIKHGVLGLIQPADKVEFWAKNGSYDNFILCRMFGGMNGLRQALKERHRIKRVEFRDSNELRRQFGRAAVPDLPEEEKHVAINDAHQEKREFDWYNSNFKL